MANKFVKGGFQRMLQTVLYFILFLCNAIILGIYSYFLSVLADRKGVKIPTWEKAVEGISGAACVYLIFATILTCCLGGIAPLAILAIILDVCFCGAMIALLVLTRHGASSCKGTVNSPIGTGPADSHNGFGAQGFGFGNDGNLVYSLTLGHACELNTAAFAVAVIAAVLFLCTAAMQIALMRHHKKEKRYGPSPDNNYTSGSGKKRFGMFGRNKGNSAKAAEAGQYTSPNNNRVSGTTAGNTTLTNDTQTKYETTTATGGGAHSGYYTAPTGTAASNPYGYNNTATNY